VSELVSALLAVLEVEEKVFFSVLPVLNVNVNVAL
jgi:hypothetical protein